MDADDISAPGRFSIQLQYLVDHPEVVVVGGQIRRIVKGEPLSMSDLPLEHFGIVKALLYGHHGMSHPAVMMRRSALEVVGGYWDQGYGEEWDLFLRMSEVGRLANLDRHVLDYTFHESGMNASDMQRMRTHIGLAICNYRRRAQGLEEFDRHAYLENLSSWERIRIRAQAQSQKAYRHSMLVASSNPTVGKLLLARAALLWPPFAMRRIAATFFRKLSEVRRRLRAR
jgi:hypothetical protein